MTKLTFSLLLATAFMFPVGVQAETQSLPATLQQIEDLQRRADTQVFSGVGSSNYHLAKARTWIDFALSEYHQKDTTGITLAAIEQAKGLLDALDAGQSSINMVTPSELAGSETVRPDLWGEIIALKRSGGFDCGKRKIAEAEVHLVWAGHEKYESGWSHAQSYARSAENLIYEAQVAINNCGGKVANMPAALVGGMEPIPAGSQVIVIEKHSFSSDALFAFNSAELRLAANPRLDKLVAAVRDWQAIDAITLLGHTDRFGTDKYNQQLSKQRAERVKQYLVSSGISANKITVIGAGSTQALITCSKTPPKQVQVRCLQPNRRVEITLRGTK